MKFSSLYSWILKHSIFPATLNIKLYTCSRLTGLGFRESFWERTQGCLDTTFVSIPTTLFFSCLTQNYRLKCTGPSMRFPIFRFKIVKNWKFQILTKNWKSEKTNTHARSDQYILCIFSYCKLLQRHFPALFDHAKSLNEAQNDFISFYMKTYG